MEAWGQTYRKVAKVKNLALKQQEATTTLGHTGEGGSGSPGPGDTDWKRGHPRGALGEKAQPFRDGQMGRNCC